MKVFVALLLVISSVAARGSGPYLPSGWKPEGPAFFLPSEGAKSILEVSAQEPLIEETEASGSDALREYGPPKLEVSLNVNQELPDVATEQNFLRVIKNDEIVADVQDPVSVEANTKQDSALIEKVSKVTESQAEEVVNLVQDDIVTHSDVPTTDVEEKSTDIIENKEVKESEENIAPQAIILEDGIIAKSAVEAAVPLFQQELQQDAFPTLGLNAAKADQETVAEAIPTHLSEEVASVTPLEQELSQESVLTPAPDVLVGRVVEGLNNIAEAIVTLEKEVTAAEVQANENAALITNIQANSGPLEQTPEGLLEYAPPGFLEYGPPKPEILPKIAAEVTSTSSLENNQVRRRRFSAKLRSSKEH